MKNCTKCNIDKELTEFYIYPTGKYRAACKVCYIKHRNTIGKNKQLKKRYGITIDQYNDLFESQKGCCAICEKPRELGGRSGLYIDHDHNTNKVRGLLCPGCNYAIGVFRENKEHLNKAIEYLSNKSVQKD